MLSVPKLYDDGSNWMDYEPRIHRAMGSKGLWMHVDGIAIAPKPYVIVNSIPVLSDGKMKAMDEQLETREARIVKFEKREYLAQHIILSTTSIRLGAVIKNLKTAKEMWDKVKNNATTKSTLYLIDAEDQLASMHVTDSDCYEIDKHIDIHPFIPSYTLYLSRISFSDRNIQNPQKFTPIHSKHQWLHQFKLL